jgi:hypothetical protein
MLPCRGRVIGAGSTPQRDALPQQSQQEGRPFDNPAILPDYALSHILGYLAFADACRLTTLSKGWRTRLREEGEPLWKEQLQKMGLADGSHHHPPEYFVVSNSDGLGLESIAHLLQVDRDQLFVIKGRWKAENEPLEPGSVVQIDYQTAVSSSRQRREKTGRRRKNKRAARPQKVSADSCGCLFWWQRRREAYLMERMLERMFQYLRQAKIDSVWTAHGFDIKRVSDLAPLTPTIINGVYHYNNGHRMIRSRSKEAWLADRYLQDFQVSKTPAERILYSWRPTVMRWVSGKGSCLGSTQSWGWFMLGPKKDRVRYLLRTITEEHTYGLSCINNRNYKNTTANQYKESVRLLLELFLGAAEPGAKFLYATEILDTDDENDDNGVTVGGDEWQQEQQRVVEASDADDPLPDLSRQQFHGSSRGSHQYGDGADTDVMVVAIGNTYVLSFYCYMNRFWY